MHAAVHRIRIQGPRVYRVYTGYVSYYCIQYYSKAILPYWRERIGI